MTDQTPHDETPAGIDRRTMLKRGAIVGGALVWTTPVVQSLAGPAFGQEVSPGPGLQGCPDGEGPFYVKFDGPGETDDGIGGTVCADTTGTSSGADIEGISVEFDGLTATVTLPAGYVLDEEASGLKSGTGEDACSGTIVNNGDGTYTFTSTATNADNGNGNSTAPSDISNVQLVFICVPT